MGFRPLPIPSLLPRLADFARAHWRPLAGVGALVLAFGVGRGMRPAPRVEVRTVEHVVEKVVTKTVTVAAKQAERDEHRDVERVQVVKPDGTRITRTHVVTASEAKTSSSTQITAATVASTTTDRKTDAKPVADAPRWRVDALAGVAVPRLLPVPSAALVFGAHAQYRLIGPVWVGGWFLTSGEVGVSLGITF